MVKLGMLVFTRTGSCLVKLKNWSVSLLAAGVVVVLGAVALASSSTASPRPAQGPAHTWTWVTNGTKLTYGYELGGEVHEITYELTLNGFTGTVHDRDLDSGVGAISYKALSDQDNAAMNSTADGQITIGTNKPELVAYYNVTRDGVVYSYSQLHGIAIIIDHGYARLVLVEFPWNVAEEQDVPGFPLPGLVVIAAASTAWAVWAASVKRGPR
ncbi:MAG: hypothetical protein Kow0069_36970 [Promethearchaeota archaeon]